MSVTVTVKVQLAVLPRASVAVFVTVVVPNGNVLPLGGVLTRFVTPESSVAVTVKVTLLRLHRPASATSTRLVGQVITGNGLPVTVTVKLQLVVLPLPSVAVLVTVVVPSGNVLPLGGLLTRFVTRQLSDARTEKTTLLRLERPGSAVKTWLLGQVIEGF